MNDNATDPGKLNLEKLLELSTTIEKEIQALRGKEVTLVVGKTGSGKSTLINYLLKRKLTRFEDDTGEILIQLDHMTIGETIEAECSDKQSAKIGHEFVSETVYPKGFEIEEKGLLLCDTAGFGDNRSSENNAAAHLAVQMIIQSAALIKGVIVVVSADDFKGRATGLNETLSLLKRLIMPNENCMKNYRNSVVFVFTHAEDNSSMVKTDVQIQNLLKRAQRGLEKQIRVNPNNEDIADSLALCNIMLSSEVQVVVFDPLIEEHEDKFRDKPVGRNRILNFIERSGGIVKEDIAFRVERIFQQYSDTFCQIANSFLISRMVIMDENSRIYQYEQKRESKEREISKLMKANTDLEQYGQKNLRLENLKSELDKTNNEIDSLKNQADSNDERRQNIYSKKFHIENDTTPTVVHVGEVYSENAVYGVVKKGIVKSYSFNYSGDSPIARVECIGNRYDSTEGTSQNFSAPSYNADRRRCEIKYDGPSHEYGRAEFKVYSEKRFTPDSRAQIKRYENELEAIERKWDDIESDLNEAKETKNNLSKLILECEAQNLRDTKQLIESNKKLIENYNKEQENFSKILEESIQKLESAKSTLVKEESQYQMLIQFNEIVPFEEQTIQEFISKYDEYKCKKQQFYTSPSAAASSSGLFSRHSALLTQPSLEQEVAGRTFANN